MYLELSERISFSFTKYFARTVQFRSILAKISTIGLELLVLEETECFNCQAQGQASKSKSKLGPELRFEMP